MGAGAGRPYRTSFSRALARHNGSGFVARPLDEDDLEFIARVRDTGRLDCGSLADVGGPAKYSGYCGGYPCYPDEDACADAHARAQAVATMERQPELEKKEIPWWSSPTAAQRKQHEAENQRLLQEYRVKWLAWEKEYRRRTRAGGAEYLQAFVEFRATLSEQESFNHRTSLERMEFERKQEAERAKHHEETRAARARAELQREVDRRVAAETMKAEWERVDEQRATIEAQRERDDAEWEAEEERRAAARRELERARHDLVSTMKLLRKTERRVKDHERVDHQ